MPKTRQNSKWKKTAGTVANVATRALKTALLVKSLVNVESKVIDIAPFASGVSNTGVIYTLNSLGQGTTSVTRVGDSVKFQALHLNGYITQHASATNTIVRVWLIRFKEPRGSTINLSTDFWQNVNVLSYIQTQKRDRYAILYDRTFHLQAGGASQVQIEKHVKLNAHTKYDGNAGTIADIQTNGYFLVALSNEATNTPVINACLRLRYTDD